MVKKIWTISKVKPSKELKYLVSDLKGDWSEDHQGVIYAKYYSDISQIGKISEFKL